MFEQAALADRRDRARRHLAAEAERDLARRRRLRARILPLVAAELGLVDLASAVRTIGRVVDVLVGPERG